jgi:predicted DNA-binding transcriptional regulator YafY
MPINKQALIRYKVIDQCLQNRRRKWTLEDLVEACSEALYEYEGIDKGVSVRTVQLDLQNMRGEKLGYNAPIIVMDKKYYTYEEKDFSITKIPLSKQDLGMLTEVVGLLKQLKGLNYFEEMSGMIARLEDKVIKQKHQGRSAIDFEKNELLKGLEFIDPLHKTVLSKTTLQITYQSFKANKPSEIIFYPYLLKEYRNRWFIFGMNRRGKSLLNLALDRIIEIKELSEIVLEEPAADLENFYSDVIGVTKSRGQSASTVVLKIAADNAPYVITKPLHSSQKILKEEKDWTFISINVVLNFELEREILGFGDRIEVLAPRILRKNIMRRLGNASSLYKNDEIKE